MLQCKRDPFKSGKEVSAADVANYIAGKVGAFAMDSPKSVTTPFLVSKLWSGQP